MTQQHGDCSKVVLAALLSALLIQFGCGSSTDPAPSQGSVQSSEQDSDAGSGSSDSASQGVDDVTDPGSTPVQPAPPVVNPDWPSELADLVSDDLQRRAVVADQVAANPPALEFVLEMFAAGSDTQRQGAGYYLLSQYRGNDAVIETAVAAAAADSDARVRRLSLDMIKRFGQAARQEINPRLLDRLADQVEPDVGNRATIARMMASQRNPSDAVKDQLADVARHDPAAEVRQAALYAIGRLATDDRLLTLLPRILTEDEDASVRRMAAIRLGRMGVRATGAAPQLAAMMEEDDEALSDAAAQALIKIGPKTLPVLVTALESSLPRTRRLAILALSTMGREAQPAVKALQRRLADDEADIRQLARMTIKKILLLQ